MSYIWKWASTGRIFKVCGPVLVAALSAVPAVQAAESAECYRHFNEADYQQALTSCREDAELGDAKAALLLATIYYQGFTGEADDQRGLFWDKVAAEKGSPGAAYRIALAYQIGQGVNQNMQQAFRWYKQAAQAGHSKAQFNLAKLYEQGSVNGQDLPRAHSWFMKAAQSGLPEAQLKIGGMLLEGEGVDADRARAQHWIRKAAEAGNHNAQLALGVMLAEFDPQDSAIWYQRSADQGNLVAMQNLALAYLTGQGVKADRNKALALAQEAVDRGNHGAVSVLQQIQLKLEQQKIVSLRAEKAKVDAMISSNQLEQPLIAENQTVVAEIITPPVASTEIPSEPTAAGQRTDQIAGAQSFETNTMAVQDAVKIKSTQNEAAPSLPVSTESSLAAAQSLSVGSVNSPFSIQPDGWILHQSDNRFTIQLTNGDSEVGIHQFIRKNQLPDTVRYYRTQRQSGVFYVLIYGDFDSVKAAKSAYTELPEKLRSNLWIRNFSQLQGKYRQPLAMQ